MTVGELKDALTLNVFYLADPQTEITGGYVGDLLSWVMGRAKAGDMWITIMSNLNVAAVAAMTDVACVVLAEGVTPDENLLKKAQAQGVNLLGSGENAFSIAVRSQVQSR